LTKALLERKPNKKEMATAIQHSDIKESDTARQYNNFYNRCYSQAKGKLSIIKKEELRSFSFNPELLSPQAL
jgi:hypothetical protein